MSNFVSSITLNFKDMFSSGIRRAATVGTRAIRGVGASLKSLGGGDLLQTSAHMSLVSGHASRMARSVTAATDGMSREASDFESSMAAVRSSLAVSVGAGSEMEGAFGRLTSAARAWSGQNSDSAAEYAQTSYMMLSAGLDTEAALLGTNAALLLAKATMGDASSAGNLLATTYNNMKRDGEGAQEGMSRLSDVVAKTQSMFQIKDLNQLSEGLKYATAAAKPAGMQFEQVATIIGQLNSAGLQGGQAGTAFSATLRNMDKAGKKLGFEVALDDGGGLDFIKTLENINQKFGEVETRTVAQRQALQRAFGDEGIRAVNLLGSDVEKLALNFVGVQNATGTTSLMAGQMADTYVEKLKTAENTVSNFKARLGVGANAVRLFGAQMGAGLAGLGNWAAELPGIGGMLIGLTGGALQAGGSLLSLASSGLSAGTGVLSFMMVAEKMGGIGKLTRGVGVLGKTIFKIIPLLIGWAGAAWTAAAAHIAVAWPIYAVIGGIAALATGVFFLVKHWRAVVGFMRSAVVGAFNFVKNAVVGVWEWFGKIASNPLIAMAGVLFAPLIAIPVLIMKHWQPIKDFFGTLLGSVGKVIGAVGSFLGIGNNGEASGASSARTGMPYGGARAGGGPVSSGHVYTVGERGIEHFIPSVAGTVISNRNLRTTTEGRGSSSGQVTNINIGEVRMDAPRDMQHMLDLFTQLAAVQQIR